MSLNLSRNQVVDVSPLSRLPVLETLDLSRNRIADPSPLLDLMGVSELNVSRNCLATSGTAVNVFAQIEARGVGLVSEPQETCD